MSAPVVGTCSECGGRVTKSALLLNAIPTCQDCHAVAKYSHGPLIQMKPIADTRSVSGTMKTKG